MKTVKDVAEISGISIRTLRYYDEIGLLKPTQITDAGYRLYDNKALEKLQEIMFFRELEIPLMEIRNIMKNPDFDKQKVLATQKALLERKRNRLDGIIQLISDVMKGVNTMNFEAFNNEDSEKIVGHMLSVMSEEERADLIKQYGSLESFQSLIFQNLQDEKTNAQFIKWYGSKEKAIKASVQSLEIDENLKQQQTDINEIYKEFVVAKQADNVDLANEAVSKLSKSYKKMFQVENARNMLLDFANCSGFLNSEQLAKSIDSQYGEGIAQYIAKSIRRYYGI